MQIANMFVVGESKIGALVSCGDYCCERTHGRTVAPPASHPSLNFLSFSSIEPSFATALTRLSV